MRAVRRAADNVIREKGKRVKEARGGVRVSVTHLTDSKERVITAAGGARRVLATFFLLQTRSSRSWVGSFHSFAVESERVCLARASKLFTRFAHVTRV